MPSASFLGLGLWFAWAWISFYSPTLLPVVDGCNAIVRSLWMWHLGALSVTLLSGALVARPASSLVGKKAAIIGACTAMMVGTAIIALAYRQSGMDAFQAAVLGTVLASAGHGVLILMWGESYSALHADTACACAAIAIVLGTVTYFVARALQPAAAIVMVVAVPLVCGLMLAATNQRETRALQAPNRSFALPQGLLLSLSLCAVACGYSRGMGEESPIHPYLFFGGAGLAGLLIALQVVVFSHRLDLFKVYRLVLLLIVGGLLLLPLLPASQVTVATTIIIAGWVGFEILFWTMVAATPSDDGRLALRTFGWLRFGVQAGMLAGVLAGEVIAYLDIGALPEIVVALGLAYALVYAATIVFSRPTLIVSQEDNAEDIATPPDDGLSPLAHVCACLSEEHLLTAREQEVLILLASGRNVPHIRQALYLSESTVKTHVRHIYAKMGVHSRQELLDEVHKRLE